MVDVYGLIRPLVFTLPAETAHRLTINILKARLWPAQWTTMGTGGNNAVPRLETSLFGLQFQNPVGLAAGFDKDGEVADQMLRLGFGFAEVGTVTPRPQPGNARPRLFRLKEDRAVINRFGFNNRGAGALAGRLKARDRSSGVVGANIGANKDSADPVADYVTGLKRLYGLADYFTVNVSSPNTPGLRGLQDRDALDGLLSALMSARAACHGDRPGSPTPLLLKIAPDLTDAEQVAIAEVVLERRVDGLIVSNTTISRPESLISPHRGETGGLSGAPLFDLSTAVLARMYRLTNGQIPLVGVGGIGSGADAYAKIRAGASLVQIYSALVYEGPGLVSRICKDLARRLAADGFRHVQDAVGADA